jgi:hypothetical protein
VNLTTLAAIRIRLDRLERRQPKPARPTLWDALSGAAPPGFVELPPPLAAALAKVAALTDPPHDRVALRLAELTAMPCGLKEIASKVSPGPQLN